MSVLYECSYPLIFLALIIWSQKISMTAPPKMEDSLVHKPPPPSGDFKTQLHTFLLIPPIQKTSMELLLLLPSPLQKTSIKLLFLLPPKIQVSNCCFCHPPPLLGISTDLVCGRYMNIFWNCAFSVLDTCTFTIFFQSSPTVVDTLRRTYTVPGRQVNNNLF